MVITTIGLDLTMSIPQVHAVDAAGTAVVSKALRRSQVLPFWTFQLPTSGRERDSVGRMSVARLEAGMIHSLAHGMVGGVHVWTPPLARALLSR